MAWPVQARLEIERFVLNCGIKDKGKIVIKSRVILVYEIKSGTRMVHHWSSSL